MNILKLLMAICLLLAGFAQAQEVVYYHTDALGTPVAITDATGTVIQRSVYAPYGELLNRPMQDGPGYTGHVSDATTGLVYMQQRYYDPMIPRFLSVDPVAVDSASGWNFCRYCYAANNPYKFKDPDGRVINFVLGFAFGAGMDAAMQIREGMSQGQSFKDAVGNIDLVDVAIAGSVSAIIPGLGGVAKAGYQGAKVAIPAAKAVAKVTSKSANTANRVAKNAASIEKNIDKIKDAAADVGKSTATAFVHQVVKADAQVNTPADFTVNDARDAAATLIERAAAVLPPSPDEN